MDMVTESADFEEIVRVGRQSGDFALSISDFRWRANFAARYKPARHLLLARIRPSHVEMLGALGGTSSFYKLGNLMYFPAGVQVETLEMPRMGGSHNIRFEFSDAWLRQHHLSADIRPAGLQGCLDITNAHLSMYLHRAATELMNPGIAADLLINGLAEALTVDLLNHVSRDGKTQPVRSTQGKLDRAGLHRILEMVAYDPSCRLSDLAGQLGWSVGHLSKAFRNTTDTPLHKHITEVRTASAREMLRDGMPIKQVAHRLGFSSVSAFSRAYFNETGQRPSEWRDDLTPRTQH